MTLHPDGTVAIVCHRSEMGQGIRTTMPMIIADEMEADWAQCRVVQADGDDKKYGSQNTDGSTSIRDFLPRYREAGATVRALLEDAAAAQWGVAASEVKAQQHTVVHAATGRTLDLRRAGARGAHPRHAGEGAPAGEEPRRAPLAGEEDAVDRPRADDHRHGALRRRRRPPRHEDRRHRPPAGLGRDGRRRVDDAAARKVPGVERIVRFPEFPIPGGYMPLGGVAVVAAHTWAAIQGAKALAITWTPGPNAAYESKSYRKTPRGLGARRREARAARRATSKPGSPRRRAGSRPSTTCRTSRTPRWSRWSRWRR